MPELPEVETIRLSLLPGLLGKQITGGEVLLPKLIQELSPEEFLAGVSKREITALKRRGKYLILELDQKWALIVHLRMTGQLVLENTEAAMVKATYLKLQLNEGYDLRYRDQRKFGRIWLFEASRLTDFFAKLGPEPLEDDFTVAVWEKRLQKRQLAIKKLLLNQEIIAGLGNIYADEALFLAGILPERPANQLTELDVKNLYTSIRQVLQEGIEHRGTSKKDYLDGTGQPGSYQEKLRVYGRKNLPCVACGEPILKVNLGGRGTHYCGKCQH